MEQQISRAVSGVSVVFFALFMSVVFFALFSQSAFAFFEMPTPRPTNEDKVWLQENSKENIFPEFTTRLVWQDNEDVVKYRRVHTSDTQAGETSGSSLGAREYCERLELAGYKDWELPTKEQLSALNRDFRDQLVHGKKGVYWSSSEFAPTPNMFYSVSAEYPVRGVRMEHGSLEALVRCVRKTK